MPMATSQNTASLKIRPAEMADAEKCGDILYRAFQTIADHHNFQRDCPSGEPE
jgi:hypothetical protein